MAVTKLWKIKTNLKRVIEYDVDSEKTVLENSPFYKNLSREYRYVTNADKTENQYFVTGLNCIASNALKEMIATKRKFNKEDKILGYHGYQSFVKGETTPEIAHEIGVKLAEELWGDRFEVIVSTHLNTDCLHNHFLINSVSFDDGMKFYSNLENTALMRATSDAICEEYGLNVLEEKTCSKSKINFDNFVKSKYQNSSYYNTSRQDIDRAISQAYSYKDFEKLLGIYGYTLTYRANKLSVCRSGYKRNIRIERAYGSEYTIERIKERIKTENSVRVPFQEVYARKKYTSNKSLKTIKKIDKKYRSSLYRLCLYYRYKLNSYRKKEYRQPLTDEQRKAIRQMDKYSEEVRFLSSRNILTVQELSSYKKEALEELSKVELRNRSINIEIKNCTHNEEKQKLNSKKQNILLEKSFWKSEVEICREIELRIPKMKEEVKEKKVEKESERVEHIR